MTPKAETAPERLAIVRRTMEEAARAAGRQAADVTLVAVSKTFDAEAIRPVLEAGQRVFGENRVQEARDKWPALREAHPDVELHLLGPLQSNKVKDAVRLFDVIQSVDRDKIAAEIAKAARTAERFPRLLVQVNIGEEPQKAGIPPAETKAFLARCRDVHGLAIEGLMCIPPLEDDPVPHFRRMKALRDATGLPVLSMGMSGDYREAIAEGATMVRVGSAIFGARPPAGG